MKKVVGVRFYLDNGEEFELGIEFLPDVSAYTRRFIKDIEEYKEDADQAWK